MNNDIQNFVDDKERARINLYIELSLITFFTSVIIFSVLVLIG
jgi:hypothetical protein